MIITRSYNMPFYPTREQANQLAQIFGNGRYLWNRALCQYSIDYANYQVALLSGFLPDDANLSDLLKEYDIICIEDLNLKGMSKNRKLSRAISNTGIGELYRQLIYKAK